MKRDLYTSLFCLWVSYDIRRVSYVSTIVDIHRICYVIDKARGDGY